MLGQPLHPKQGMFRCREGDPERSAILFVDHCSNVRGARLIEGDSDMLDLPMLQILADSPTLCAR